MKLYISADLEGVLGVTSPHQCFPTQDPSGYHQAVNQLSLELNTLIDAFKRQGVTDVTVNDSHGYMANLAPLHLPNHVRLLTGKPKACAMSAGLDRTYDIACYVGYHSKAGTLNGVLCHTFHDQVWDVAINDVSLGETGVNALYAGSVFGVPVGLISGDAALCAEATQLMPDVLTVCTKQGLSFSAAIHESWDTVKTRYEEAAARLCQRLEKPQPLAWAGPYTLTVTLRDTRAADIAATLPWVERLDGRRLQLISDDMTHLYKGLQAMYAILAYPATPAASHLD